MHGPLPPPLPPGAERLLHCPCVRLWCRQAAALLAILRSGERLEEVIAENLEAIDEHMLEVGGLVGCGRSLDGPRGAAGVARPPPRRAAGCTLRAPARWYPPAQAVCACRRSCWRRASTRRRSWGSSRPRRRGAGWTCCSAASRRRWTGAPRRPRCACWTTSCACWTWGTVRRGGGLAQALQALPQRRAGWRTNTPCPCPRPGHALGGAGGAAAGGGGAGARRLHGRPGRGAGRAVAGGAAGGAGRRQPGG